MSLGRRTIPILQLRGRGLVKTQRFGRPTYLGDPVNAVRIFNEMGVDELAVVVPTFGAARPKLDWALLADMASEAFMPMSFGGGIADAEDAQRICETGFEKVIVGSGAFEIDGLVRELSQTLGSQSVVVAIDYRVSAWRRTCECRIRGGKKGAGFDPVSAARMFVNCGAGEILLTNIDRDGCGTGYDIEVLTAVVEAVRVPVVVNGGARNMADAAAAFLVGAAGAAGGSMFVFAGDRRSVLIGHPSADVREQ